MSHTVETTGILVYSLHGIATYFKNQPDKIVVVVVVAVVVVVVVGGGGNSTKKTVEWQVYLLL
jgi:hypothetical protein